jgi:hypothetical protein
LPSFKSASRVNSRLASAGFGNATECGVIPIGSHIEPTLPDRSLSEVGFHQGDGNVVGAMLQEVQGEPGLGEGLPERERSDMSLNPSNGACPAFAILPARER